MQIVRNTIDTNRFLTLSVRPGQWHKAREELTDAFDFETISFDELLLRHLHSLCDGMANPPN